MKNPWLIGLLSIVPGLGLAVLGEVRKGVTAILLIVLAIMAVFSPWEKER